MKKAGRIYISCVALLMLLFVLGRAFAGQGADEALRKLAEYRMTGAPASLKAALKAVDGTAASLGDAVSVASAAEQAYQATGDRKYLRLAEEAAARMPEVGPGMDPAEARRVMLILTDLCHITGDQAYRKKAEAAYAALGEKCQRAVFEFIVVGKENGRDTRKLMKDAFMFDDPDRVVIYLDPDKDGKRLDDLGYEYPGKAVMYVCSESVCFPPVYSGDTLARTRQSIKKVREQNK